MGILIFVNVGAESIVRSSSKLAADSHKIAGISSKLNGKYRRVTTALAAALALTTAFTVIVPEPAEARRRGYTQVVRQPAQDEPLTLVVSLREQRLKVFDSRGLVAQSSISSGRSGHRTPTGIFTILQKNREHYSNLYDGAPMPNMQRITWSGIALHAGHLPGYPASHGCIRLPYGFSRSLFSMTKLGTRVVVHDDMIEPRSFRHTKLFAALPPGKADIPHPVRRADAVAARSKAAGLSTVSAMLGVTPAAAAEAALEIAARPGSEGAAPSNANAAISGATTPSVVRTRATALAARQAEIDQKATIITDREELHGQAAAVVAEVNGRLNEARADLAASRKAVPSLKRDVSRQQAAVARAERELKRFIDRQQREMRRAEDRAERREKQHLADAASDLDTETLLKRSEARKAEAERDQAAHDTAAEKEIELEAAYLQAIHDHEIAEKILHAQDDVIAARAQKLKAIQTELVDVKKVYTETRNALDLARDEYKRSVAAVQHFAKPATVFVSRRTGMLKIRQGNAEVYATPVKIAFPEAKLGTHVYTAMNYTDRSETEMAWQSLTLTDESPELPRRPRGASGMSQSLPPAPTADNALERIEMPEEARERIAELVKPGSSLIISDDTASPETGPHTDFIVQPRI